MKRQTTQIGFDRMRMLHSPYRELGKINALGGVVWSEPLGIWFITGHQFVTEALRDRRFTVLDAVKAFQALELKSGYSLDNLTSLMPWIPFLLEGDQHKSKRGLFARFLSRIKGEYLRQYEEVSTELLTPLKNRQVLDFAQEYANRIHVLTVGRLGGFLASDCIWLGDHFGSEGFQDFVIRLADTIDANERIGGAIEKVGNLVDQESESWLVQSISAELEIAGLDASRENKVQFLSVFMLLGRDTIAATLATSLFELLSVHGGALDSETWIDPSLAIDEIIRIPTAVQFVSRGVTDDLVLGGQSLKQGDKVILFLNAANRDESVYECPHAFMSGQTSHVAFGAARHLCSGMPMSKEAIKISFQHLARFRSIHLLPGSELASNNRVMRTMKSLPIMANVSVF